ncbi:redox-regulated ATPase YchF [Miltoncostaea marina]|uniref:redox-regulated ATPase YchF n=1 Tax=Miltoncostaea marina TaxID=2843215 RepID=UPI001C3DF7C2|nr:redox-regulated ATPase YchF [Miltoncostaea marina]
MDLGLVGRANAGKTALFSLVTGAEAEIAPYPFTTREPQRAMADVPDPRLDAIADAQDIPRRVPAQVQLVDIAGLAAGAGHGEGLGGAALGQLRQADALLHVVRAFANAEVPHPEERVDPLADAEAVDLELAVADRDQSERRLERVRKTAKSGDAAAIAEAAALERLIEALDAGRPARSVDDEAATAVAADMGLLTAKPVLYIANTDEELEPPADLAAHAAAQGAQALALPVGLELELAAMDPEEAAELAAEMELGGTRGADAVVAGAYRLLDLVTFFTGSGPPEARAWPIRRGTTAAAAAGKIHSDLERGFIRAEVIPWDDLVAAGSWARAREAATLRMEGRDYVVQEGDVMQVRFNV